jgi:hypothetical protein
MDRNFPGAPRISRMLATGTHVLIRVRDGIMLNRAGDFLPDGSYLAGLSGGGVTLTVRVIEYTVSVAGRDAPELFCLITDLTDHAAYPAGVLAAAYHWRWIGSETALKEAKSAISGAGPSTGAMLRSSSPALIAQEHAAWVTATELARATARAAAAIAVPAGKGKRAGQPVHPREISFTAARRAVISTTRAGTATASLPAPAVTANRDRTLASLARRRVDINRHRHRDRTTKTRLSFPPAGRACPRSPHGPRSASACPSPPDPLPRPPHPPARGTSRRPERQPGCGHARQPQSLSVEHPAGRIGQRSVSPEHPITPFYMALGPGQPYGTGSATRSWARCWRNRKTRTGIQLAGEGSMLGEVVKAVLERALESELTTHLGYRKHDPAGNGSGNSRNGSSALPSSDVQSARSRRVRIPVLVTA